MNQIRSLSRYELGKIRSVYAVEGVCLLSDNYLAVQMSYNRPMLFDLVDGQTLTVTITRESYLEIIYDSLMRFQLQTGIIWFAYEYMRQSGKLAGFDNRNADHIAWYRQVIEPFHFFILVEPVSQTQLGSLLVMNGDLVTKGFC